MRISRKQSDPNSSRRIPILTRKWLLNGLYLAAVTGFIFWVAGGNMYDDPFITYRYAANLAGGAGFVYNPGVRVQSTTTPLFALLLALLSPLNPNLPVLANWIGALSLAAGGLLLYHLAVSLRQPVAGLAGLLLYPFFPLLAATLGSETPLYLALMIAAFVFFARRAYTLAAACSALALLARPDGLLVPALLGAAFAWEWLRTPGRAWIAIPWKAVFLFFLLAVPWFLFAWSYFGSPIPATLVAKQQQGAMPVSEQFAEGFLTVLRWYTSWPFLLEGLLGLVGTGYLFLRARSWLLFAGWAVLYFLAYTVLGVSRYFWYYAPLIPAFIALVGLGAAALSRVRVPAAWPQKLPLVVAVALILAAAAGQTAIFVQMRTPVENRYPIYRAAGTWLAENTAPGESVGAVEVGIIGYYAGRPMVDFAGLIQPEVAAHLGAGASYEDAAFWAVEAYQPDYLVLVKSSLPGLEAHAESECRTVKVFSGSDYGFRSDLLIFDCK